MRRSTGLAAGARLRRATILMLPLLAVCASASPARAGVRSQAATAQAIASALSQSTGLTPSQVTSAAACPPAAPGFARCDAESLVLRSNHARVHPHVRGGSTFSQVFPTGGRGIPSARPAVTVAGGGFQPSLGTPAWLQQAYDLTYLSLTGGVGDTVAIVDAYDDPTAQSDLDVFRSTYGLPPCDAGCFQKVTQGGATQYDAGWATEESLDLDAVSAICPNCHIVLVEASDNSVANLSAAELIAAHLSPGVQQISNSWSANATSPIAGTYTFPPIAVLAATGDHGYVGGGYDAYPAAFLGVTAVGGTAVAPASGSARGFGESAWSLDGGWGASSGCDTSEAPPSYQPAGGCAGRAYSDVSADADPVTGLNVYDDGSWEQVGGTSLATPVIAAYEAITGVDGSTPQWAYDDSAVLNDPATGSSGDCDLAILYICNAGPGYDGPTGIGSISGAVVPGAPGIGGPSFGGTYTEGLGETTATLGGGVYPNGLDSTYYWQYGPTTSYGSQTATVDVSASRAPTFASAALSGLAPGTTYHYRLVAQNDDGITYGYDSELTTAAPPVNTVLPAIAGSGLQGLALFAYPGGWNPAGSSLSYAWQRTADGVNWTTIAGASGSTYTPGAADAGDELRVVVTASNAYGQSSAVSASIGPVPAAGFAAAVAVAPPRWKWLPDVSADPGRVGDILRITRGTWTGAPVGSDVIRVMRCTNTCVAVGPPNPTRYTITPADTGSSLWVQETASNAGGSAVVWSPRSVGPVVSVSSGAGVLSAGQTTVRNSRGDALAIARIGSPAGASARGPASRARPRVVELRRAAGVKGKVIAWVCRVAGKLGGPPPACTARVSLGAHARIRLSASISGAVRIVVVRRGR